MPIKLRNIIESAALHRRRLSEGTVIETRVADRAQLVFVDHGWAMKVAYAADGRRQVLRFLLPGDCVRTDVLCADIVEGTTVECITPCEVSAIDSEAALRALHLHAEGLAALQREICELYSDAECYIAMLGMLSAEERLAWMLLHLYQRAVTAGLCQGTRIPFPLNQYLLASALGLSLVHTNKTLARMRRRGMVNWAAGTLELPDRPTLAAMCGFNLLKA